MSSPNFAAINDAWRAEFPVCIFLGCLSLFTFVLRLISRHLAHEGMRLDDYLIAVGMVWALHHVAFRSADRRRCWQRPSLDLTHGVS